MAEQDNGVRRAMHVNLQPLPPKWRAGVGSFLERFHALYGLDCAILYGSMATGNYHARSDIDLVLISCGVPGDFWQRMKAVSDLYQRGVPIEALAYTPQEFKQMIEDMHVTALDERPKAYLSRIPRSSMDYASKRPSSSVKDCGAADMPG